MSLCQYFSNLQILNRKNIRNIIIFILRNIPLSQRFSKSFCWWPLKLVWKISRFSNVLRLSHCVNNMNTMLIKPKFLSCLLYYTHNISSFQSRRPFLDIWQPTKGSRHLIWELLLYCAITQKLKVERPRLKSHVPNWIKYSALLLIGSRIIESATYCNQKLLAHLYFTVNKTHRLIESFGFCYHFYAGPRWFY